MQATAKAPAPTGKGPSLRTQECPELVWLGAHQWEGPWVGRTRRLTEQWLEWGQRCHFVQFPSYKGALQRVLRRPAADCVVRPWPSWPPSGRRVTGPRGGSHPGISARGLKRQLSGQIDFDRSVALVTSPLWAAWLDELPFRAIVYDCGGRDRSMALYSGAAAITSSWDDLLIERADAVVTGSDLLAEGIIAQRPDLPVTTIRNGSRVEEFARQADFAPKPSELPSNGRPLIGFVGALDHRIDWKLVESVSEKRPEAEFAFVGPWLRETPPPRVLRDKDNLHFLGPRPYESVPNYVAHFDLCWVPFRQDEVGRSSHPSEIYEYLAAGKPVVSTPVADMDSFERQLDFARSAEEVAELIRLGLVKSFATDSPTRPGAEQGPETHDVARSGRRAFAERQSWRTRAADYIDFIGTAFGDPI